MKRGPKTSAERLELETFFCGYCKSRPGTKCTPNQGAKLAHADRVQQLEQRQIKEARG